MHICHNPACKCIETRVVSTDDAALASECGRTPVELRKQWADEIKARWEAEKSRDRLAKLLSEYVKSYGHLPNCQIVVGTGYHAPADTCTCGATSDG
jgi:hypothetical protein